MKKSDLKDGMVLELRNKTERIYFNRIFYLMNDFNLFTGSIFLSAYDDNLLYRGNKDMDIVKISYQNEVLWKRDDTDWNTVPVDAKILVSNCEGGAWMKMHFAKYEDGEIYAFVGGRTSWSEESSSKWNYCKLANDEIAE